MSDFQTLQTMVKNRVIDQNSQFLTEVPALINKAIRKLEGLHNFSVMESSVTLNTTIGQRVLGNMPSDYKEFRGGNGWYVDMNGDPVKVFHRPTLEDILGEFSFSYTSEVGDPNAVLIVPTDNGGGAPEENGPSFQVQVWPFPDGNSGYTPSGGNAGEYPVTLPYWKWLADLSGAGDQNWFTDNAEDFIVNAAVGEGFMMNWDEQRAQMWYARAYGPNFYTQGVLGGEAKRVINLDKRRRVGQTNTLKARRDVYAPSNQARE